MNNERNWLCILALCVGLSACGGSPQPENVDEDSKPQQQDLNLSKENLRGFVDEIDGETKIDVGQDTNVLPELLKEGNGETERKMRVSGNVLAKEEAESLQDSVDGVELKLEMKTK